MPYYSASTNKKTPQEIKNSVVVDFVEKHNDWFAQIIQSNPNDLMRKLNDIKRDVSTIIRENYPWVN